MKTARLFLTLAIPLASVLSLSAQKAIDDEIARLEKRSDVQVYYTEKRNPATKKIYKESKTIIMSTTLPVKRIKAAFDRERENSTEATRSKGGIQSMTFRTKDTKAEYNLVENQNGAVLTVERKEYSRYPKGDGYIIIDGKKMDFSGGEFNDITSLDGLEQLGQLEDYDFDSVARLLDNIDWSGLTGWNDYSTKTVTIVKNKPSRKKDKSKSKSKNKSKSVSTSTSISTSSSSAKGKGSKTKTITVIEANDDNTTTTTTYSI